MSTKPSGRLTFTPDPRLDGRRSIEAIAFNGATPRSSTTVARYQVSPPPVPRRIRGLKLKQNVLSWKAQPGVASYEVALTLPDRTTVMRTTRRPRLKLTGLPRRGRLLVSVVGVNALGGPGRVADVKLKLK
jgi:hypothetical protein